MAEIKQPAPIKPLWPSKPGSEQQRRQRPKPARSEEKKQPTEGGGQPSEDRPRIDEYA